MSSLGKLPPLVVKIPLNNPNPSSNAALLGLPSNTISSRTTNTIEFTLPQYEGRCLQQFFIRGYYTVGPATLSDSTTGSVGSTSYLDQTLMLTSLVRPLPALGSNALWQSFQARTGRGVLMTGKTQYPEEIMHSLFELSGLNNVHLNVGNEMSFQDYPSMGPYSTNIQQAMIPFITVLKTDLPRNYDLSKTGPVTFYITPANPENSFCYASGVISAPDSADPISVPLIFPAPTGTLTSEICTALIGQQTYGPAVKGGVCAHTSLSNAFTEEGKTLAIPTDANKSYGSEQVLRNLQNLSIYSSFEIIAIYDTLEPSTAEKSAILYRKKQQSVLRTDVTPGTMQYANIPIAGLTISDVLRTVGSKTLWQDPRYSRLSMCATSGTYLEWFFGNQRVGTTYDLWSQQPDTQANNTLSDLARAILQKEKHNRGCLKGTLDGRYDRLYLADLYNVTSTRVGYNKHLDFLNVPLFTSVNVSTKSTSQEYNKSTLSLVVTGSVLSSVTWSQSLSNVSTPVLNYTNTTVLISASPSVEPAHSRVGTFISNSFDAYNIYNVAAAKQVPYTWTQMNVYFEKWSLYLSPLLHGGALKPTLEWSTNTIYFNFTTPSYYDMIVTSQEVLGAPSATKYPSSAHLYKTNKGGRESATGLCFIRKIPFIQVMPQVNGNLAIEANFPTSGIVLNAYICTSALPPSYSAGDRFTRDSSFSNWTRVLGNRFSNDILGQMGAVSSVTIKDNYSSLIDDKTHIVQMQQQLSFTHDQRVHYRNINMAPAFAYNMRQDHYDSYNYLDSFISQDSKVPPNFSLYPHPADLYSPLRSQQSSPLWLNLTEVSSLSKQLSKLPMTATGRQIRVEFDQTGLDLHTCHAGGGIFTSNQIDPFLEICYSSDLPRADPILRYGTNPSTPKFLLMRIGYVPMQEQLVDAMVGSAPKLYVPRVLSFPTYMSPKPIVPFTLGVSGNSPDTIPETTPTASYPFYEDIPSTNTSLSSAVGVRNTLYNSQRIGMGSEPDSCFIQTVAGWIDPTRQNPVKFPKVIPFKSRGLGTRYSLHVLNTAQTKSGHCPEVAGDLSISSQTNFPPSTSPYFQPMVDGTYLRQNLSNFGDWLNNITEYFSIVGNRLTEPMASLQPISGMYLDFVPLHVGFFPTVRRIWANPGAEGASPSIKLVDITVPKNIPYPSSVSSNQANVISTMGELDRTVESSNVSCNCDFTHCFYSLAKFPSCKQFQFLQLGSRIRGREYLTFNWMIDNTPITNVGGLGNMFTGWAYMPSYGAKIPNSTTTLGNFFSKFAVDAPAYVGYGQEDYFSYLGPITYAIPETYTQLLHVVSQSVYVVTLEGIKAIQGAF